MKVVSKWVHKKIGGAGQTYLGPFSWLLASPPIEPAPSLVATSNVDEGDIGLVERVMVAYRAALAEYRTTESFWDNDLTTSKRDVHSALAGDDVAAAAAVLRNPAETAMF